jgi:hypothetical protein
MFEDRPTRGAGRPHSLSCASRVHSRQVLSTARPYQPLGVNAASNITKQRQDDIIRCDRNERGLGDETGLR